MSEGDNGTFRIGAGATNTNNNKGAMKTKVGNVMIKGSGTVFTVGLLLI